MEQAQNICPRCHQVVKETDFFCGMCGQKLKEPPPSTEIGKQIGLYALSFFLPPLGLWPGIKYLKQTDQKAKTIGLISIFLTIISIVISIWIGIGLVKSINTTVSSQLNYPGLGL